MYEDFYSAYCCPVVFFFFSGNCNRVVLSYVMSAAAVIAFIPTFVIDFLKYDKSTHIKYIVIAIAVIDCTLMNSILSHTCLVVWIFPILISSLYYNRTLVLYASLFSIIGVLAANLYNFYLPEFTVAPIYNDINDQMLFTIFHVFLQYVSCHLWHILLWQEIPIC